MLERGALRAACCAARIEVVWRWLCGCAVYMVVWLVWLCGLRGRITSGPFLCRVIILL